MTLVVLKEQLCTVECQYYVQLCTVDSSTCITGSPTVGGSLIRTHLLLLLEREQERGEERGEEREKSEDKFKGEHVNKMKKN